MKFHSWGAKKPKLGKVRIQTKILSQKKLIMNLSSWLLKMYFWIQTFTKLKSTTRITWLLLWCNHVYQIILKLISNLWLWVKCKMNGSIQMIQVATMTQRRTVLLAQTWLGLMCQLFSQLVLSTRATKDKIPTLQSTRHQAIPDLLVNFWRKNQATRMQTILTSFNHLNK